MINPSKIFGRLGNSLFQYAYIYAQMREGNIPDIFIQDQKYFEKYGNDIKTLFGDGIKFKPEVAIHIRRGDYVENTFYVDLLKTNYYQKAMEMFPNSRFLIFSDDIEFCKSQFIGDEFSFSEGNDELDDLNSMAGCSSQIIANSSYSWWAGFLNPNPNKIVVYPKDWFSDNIKRIGFPSTWIQI